MLNEAQKAVDFAASHWTSIRAACKIGKIGAGAGERMVAGGVTTAEDAAVAFRKWRRGRVIWAAQLDVAEMGRIHAQARIAWAESNVKLGEAS